MAVVGASLFLFSCLQGCWQIDLSLLGVSGHWTRLPDMLTPRRSAACFVANNMIVVAGGKQYKKGFFSQGWETVRKVEGYSLSENRWIPLTHMKRKRRGSCAVVLPSGTVLVMGGEDDENYLSSCERWDGIVGHSWTSMASMETLRSKAAAVTMPDGKVMVTGGLGSTFDTFATVELYDPASNTWQAGVPMPQARDGHAAFLYAGNVYVLGGEAAGFFFLPVFALICPTQPGLPSVI